MLHMAMAVMLFAICSLAHAGKVYRCPDGSYQDKPCGHGERVVANNNRQAAPPPGADRECFDRGREAGRIVKQREQGVKVEQLVDVIEQSGKPYSSQLEEKTFTVKVFQTKGSVVEVQTLIESQCVTERQQAAAQQKAAAAPPPAPAPAPAAPAADANNAKADAERDKLCKQFKADQKSNATATRRGGTPQEMEEFADQRKMIQEKLAEVCS